MPFDFIAPKALNHLSFQSFVFELTWWRLFWKRIVRTKFDIYVFIITLTRINIFYVQRAICAICWFIQIINWKKNWIYTLYRLLYLAWR